MILLDGIIFSLQRHGGISVYFHQLLQRIHRDNVPVTLMLDGKLQQSPPCFDALATLARPARPLERYRRCRIPLSPMHKVFHSSYYRQPSTRQMPAVVTVHDFIYERHGHGPRRWVHSAQKFAAIREAQAVICISQATLDDLQDLVGVRSGQQTHVIHNGVADTFCPAPQPRPRAPFALFVGQRGAYKNFRLALDAIALLPDIELRCVGGGELRASELEYVPESVRRRVQHVGFITDNELNRFYNQALCLLYPSSYEGFGIPVIEAMRAGCPVVSIYCKAVLEVGQDALTVSAEDAPSLAHSIEQNSNVQYRAERIRRGLAVATRYSWEHCYRETLKVYRELG